MIEKIFLIILILLYMSYYAQYIVFNNKILKFKLKKEIKVKIQFINTLMKAQYIYAVIFILQMILDYKFTSSVGCLINAVIIISSIYLIEEYIVRNDEANLSTAFVLLLTNFVFIAKLLF